MSNLFIVPKVAAEQPEQREIVVERLEITGDMRADTETALRALAFLIDFMLEAGPEQLRHCADEVAENARQR